MRRIGIILLAIITLLGLGASYFLWPFDGRYYVAKVEGHRGLQANICGRLIDACCEPVQSLSAQVLLNGLPISNPRMVVTWWGEVLKGFSFTFEFEYSKDGKFAALREKRHPTWALLVVDLKKARVIEMNQLELKTHFSTIENQGYLEE